MLPGPVFQVELLTTARRRRYYAIRTLYGLALLILLVSNYGPMGMGGNSAHSTATLSTFGRRMFASFAIFQSIALLGLTPALVAGAIADEARRKTLHYLLASRLSGGEIVLGKLLARLLHVFVFIAIGLPVLSLLTLFGGVDPSEILALYAVTTTTVLLVAGVSILVSTLTKRPRDAITTAYLLVAAWLCLPPLAAQGLPDLGVTNQVVEAVNDWVYPTHPAWLLERFNTPAGVGLSALAWTCGLQSAYALLLIATAVWRLRPAFRAEGSGRFRRWRPRWKVPRWQLIRRPSCGERPMLWKELHFRRSRGVTRWVQYVVGLIAAFWIAYGVLYLAPDAFQETRREGYIASQGYGPRMNFNVYVRSVDAALFVLAMFGVSSAAAGSLTGEREGDHWISLVTTDLTGWEIVLDKMAGAIWSVRWIVSTMVALCLIGIATGSVFPLGLPAMLIETATFLGFAAALGTAISLKARTTLGALGWTIGLLIFLNGGYLLCGSPLAFLFTGPDMQILTMGVSPLLVGFSLLSYTDFDSLLGGHGPFRADTDKTVILSLLGTLAYGFAGLVLTRGTIARFDRAVGRPNRADQPARPFKEPVSTGPPPSLESSTP